MEDCLFACVVKVPPGYMVSHYTKMAMPGDDSTEIASSMGEHENESHFRTRVSGCYRADAWPR